MVLVQNGSEVKSRVEKKGSEKQRTLGSEGGERDKERERKTSCPQSPPPPVVRSAPPVRPPSRPAPSERCDVRALGRGRARRPAGLRRVIVASSGEGAPRGAPSCLRPLLGRSVEGGVAARFLKFGLRGGGATWRRRHASYGRCASCVAPAVAMRRRDVASVEASWRHCIRRLGGAVPSPAPARGPVAVPRRGTSSCRVAAPPPHGEIIPALFRGNIADSQVFLHVLLCGGPMICLN